MWRQQLASQYGFRATTYKGAVRRTVADSSKPQITQDNVVYTLSNFEIRRDDIRGTLRASLRGTLKHTCVLWRSPQIRNDITSNLEAGQSVTSYSTFQHFKVHGQLHQRPNKR